MELIGQILLRQTGLTDAQLDAALQQQQSRTPRRRLGEILLEEGWITPGQCLAALAEQWQIELWDFKTAEQLPANEIIHKFSLEFLKKHLLLPAIDPQGQMVVVMSDPLDVTSYDAVLNVLGRYAPRALALPEVIVQAIGQCYYNRTTPGATDTEETTAAPSVDILNAPRGPEDLLNIANQPPIIRLVNTILYQAVQSRASDIHIEPYDDKLVVRLRIDGVLHEVMTPARSHLPALVSRLKIMGNLNIAERRLPQDGQSRIRIGDKEMDVRLSTIPTSAGERVVVRLLDKGEQQPGLHELGFPLTLQKEVRQLVHLPHGMMLLTGPTGSGKTTTLYAALSELNRQERNILTVEDPIEYKLAGIGQMQVKPKIGLTFASCLRHILRQDPDVIMVGEIRDHETAEIAIQASLTGHLVLSTLHTNDSASAVTRLVDMGVESYLISSSLAAVMAQRLARVICPDCKQPCHIEADVRQAVGVAEHLAGEFYTGTGCDHCLKTGYRGRTGLFELLLVDEITRDMISQRRSTHEIKQRALDQGMITLREFGIQKAREGVTTLEEVLRVTQDVQHAALRMTHDVGV